MGFGDSVRRFLSAASEATRAQVRDSGPPTSSNGASSHHLFWERPAPEPIVELRATIEIVEPPTADSLYFWALQASFGEGDRIFGAGHLGLQHHPRYPASGAVNWGGYHDRSSGRTGELDGSALARPSTLGNPNTCDFPWRAGVPYRLRIARVAEGWAGSITDLTEPDHVEIVLRVLHCDGTELRSPMTWTEAFADCDAPPTAVRWSALEAVGESGEVHEVRAVMTNYQSVAEGGCSTTESVADGDGVVQRTGVERSVPNRVVMRW